MKTHHHHHQQQHQQHPKLKNPPCSLFSCGIFGHCTETVLSPTNHQTPTLPLPPTPPVSNPQPPPSQSLPPLPPPPPPPPFPESESTTSSSSTSQSFTQWRFHLPSSPMKHNPPSESRPQIADNNPNPPPETTSESNPPPPFPTSTTTNVNLEELFHIAELQFSSGSEPSKLSALHLLERSLVPNPQPNAGGTNHPTTCPPPVMAEVVSFLKHPLGGKPATKVLLALCLSEGNRHVAVEAGAVLEVIEALAELEGAAAERALAALELLCTVAEGAAELKAHALAVPMLIEAMRKMEGRGKECAVSVLAVIFSGGGGGGGEEGFAAEAPEEVGRAVVLALQGECSARGRRKGAQLLKVLQENGRLDLTEDGMR